MRDLFMMLPLLLVAAPAAAQDAVKPAPARPVRAEALTAPPAASDRQYAPAAGQPVRTILFVGNSFTQGAHSGVRNWHPEYVTDLNGAGYGGVPSLFAALAKQKGLNYAVSLETQGGKTLGFHYAQRRQLFDRAWDVVVLQELSTLSREQPGDPIDYIRDVGRLTKLFRSRNPDVQIQLMSTWTRADETYLATGHWYGKPVSAMAVDLRAAADTAKARTPGVTGILPVGEAWNRAMNAGVADPNPYDGRTYGQMDLWTYDHYHASVHGYYLEALIVFGRVTGIDPTSFGKDEAAADSIGISPDEAVQLQKVAADQITAETSQAQRR
ncbi:hypothetical protein FHT00_003347 [Sphingomonas insulae]|uniref:PEP-CTERM sorting domain-containing protein n=1 Tax=Sphingomonas insulae TaxID=424800 RepID=A0ABN1HQ86_9SPHN|nr:DUF4886 domain-containing protein [Sphingomonas insulae]NIJ31368.1 hypothetical protein [Sphingomonas insulae]